jgi:hypothetical protein
VHRLQLDGNRDRDLDPNLGEIGLRHCGDQAGMRLDHAEKMLENQMVEGQHW